MDRWKEERMMPQRRRWMEPGKVVDAKEMGKDRYVLICISFFVG